MVRIANNLRRLGPRQEVLPAPAVSNTSLSTVETRSQSPSNSLGENNHVVASAENPAQGEDFDDFNEGNDGDEFGAFDEGEDAGDEPQSVNTRAIQHQIYESRPSPHVSRMQSQPL